MEVELANIFATSGSISIMSLCFEMYLSFLIYILVCAHAANGLPTTV